MTGSPSWPSIALRLMGFRAGVVLMAFGVVVLAGQRSALVREQEYVRDGRLVEGLVVNKAIKRETRPGSGGSTTTYSASYRFSTGADTVEGEDVVPSNDWGALREMTPVRIQFLPSDPSTNRLAGNAWGAREFALVGAGMAALAIGFALLARSVLSARARASRQ